MNEECLLKYLLNPDELETLTELLQNFTKEILPAAEKQLFQPVNKTKIMSYKIDNIIFCSFYEGQKENKV